MAASKKSKIFNPVSQRKVFNRCVKIAMARKDIETQSALAALLGMPRSCLTKRMNGETDWSFDELCRLFRVLEFQPEEVAMMMGVVA